LLKGWGGANGAVYGIGITPSPKLQQIQRPNSHTNKVDTQTKQTKWTQPIDTNQELYMTGQITLTLTFNIPSEALTDQLKDILLDRDIVALSEHLEPEDWTGLDISPASP